MERRRPDGSARRYAHLCLEASQSHDVAPFYLAYAYEALARAKRVAGNRGQMASYVEEAQRIADSIPDEDARGFVAGRSEDHPGR